MAMRTTTLVALALGLVLGAARLAIAQDPASADDHGRAYHLLMIGKPRITVASALQSADRRLSKAKCQLLFDDFTDQAGHPLRISVAATGRSPADMLADLYFVDADESGQCRTYGVVAAFTTPGGRVVYVCGVRFAQFAVNTKSGAIVLIHELLHTLGLGENPPASWQITKAVMNRCG